MYGVTREDIRKAFKILHVTLNFVKFSFKYHMYLLSSVLFLLFALANEDL